MKSRTPKRRLISACLPLWLAVAGFLLASEAHAQGLQASAFLEQSGQTVWSYTITNGESLGSNNWLTYFYLPVGAPIRDVQSPNGWSVDTDGVTYVQWSNIEPDPYPDDIPPGGSVAGFQFTTDATTGGDVGYEIGSWDHGADGIGPTAAGTVLAPISSAPEPLAADTLGIGAAALAGLALTRRLRAVRRRDDGRRA